MPGRRGVDRQGIDGHPGEVPNAKALVVLAGVATALVLARRRTPRTSAVVQRAANPAVVVAADPLPPLRVTEGFVEVQDYNTWFAIVPRAVRVALQYGERDAETILVGLFNALLPDHSWPPPVGTSLRWQWDVLVQKTAEVLATQPEPAPYDPSPGLRVVQGGV